MNLPLILEFDASPYSSVVTDFRESTDEGNCVWNAQLNGINQPFLWFMEFMVT
jgi:hypothetical protein